jgi:D-alanyl-D-alanine carboxypeptidase/D-alanyl-D-alanine-endopeptidase (penicillin-binding protein 4)
MLNRRAATAAAILAVLMLTVMPAAAQGDWRNQVEQLAGSGAVLAVGEDGKPLVSVHPDRPLIPASILKIAVMAAALDQLGPDFRFTTEFDLSEAGDLYVVGGGDPFLFSPDLAFVAERLARDGLRQVRHIYMDPGYFAPGVQLHRTNASFTPYDAYNGALCINFNTILVKVDAGGRIVSADPQTPLTPLALKKARQAGVKDQKRLYLSQDPQACVRYAGEVLAALLAEAGAAVRGEVRVVPSGDAQDHPLLYIHRSRLTLIEAAGEILAQSNNFATNQVFLTLGAEKYGPPATAEKARRAVDDFMTARGLPHFHMEEGSGLSRRTRITAEQMIAVLEFFKPYRRLLTPKGRGLVKTGSLSNVKSLAGYLQGEGRRAIPFVILLNGRVSQTTVDRIFKLLEVNLLDPSK